MRVGVLWRLAALCFAAGWWCCSQVELYLEQQLLVAQAEAEARAAAGEPL